MLRKTGYVTATVIAAVLFYPAATFRAKSAQPVTTTAIIPHQEPVSKPQDKLVINTKLVNLTVSVNDKLDRFVTGLTKENF